MVGDWRELRWGDEVCLGESLMYVPTSLDRGVFQTATDYCGQKKTTVQCTCMGSACIHTCEVLPVFVE